MTLVEPSAVAGPARTAVGGWDGAAWRSRARAVRQAALTEHLVVLGLLVVVVAPVAQAGGGRSAGALGWTVPLVVLALALTRPWQRVDTRGLSLVALVSVAALLALVVDGGGRVGAVTAAAYGTCLACGVVVAAYARSRSRRAAVATVLCAGAVAQFGWALVPWWGAGDPSRPMVGTYDWHNQYAAALLAPALLGFALLLAGRRPWRSAGWVTAPLAVAGVVLSTSRATLALLAVGWLAVWALALLGGRDRRAFSAVVARGLVCSVVAAGLTFLLPGPPLFSTSVSPFAGASARAGAGETLDQNGTYRTEFWRESLTAFRTEPVTGVGYGRVAVVAAPRSPSGWAVSPLAHSGPLQALAEGGLLLALPLALLLGAVLVALLRRLRGPTGPAHPADTLLVRAAVVASLLLGVHAAVDTDWSYPALAAQAAVVAGLALAVRAARPAAGEQRRLAAAASAVLVLSVVTGGVVAWGQPFHISDPRSTSATTSGGGHS